MLHVYIVSCFWYDVKIKPWIFQEIENLWLSGFTIVTLPIDCSVRINHYWKVHCYNHMVILILFMNILIVAANFQNFWIPGCNNLSILTSLHLKHQSFPKNFLNQTFTLLLLSFLSGKKTTLWVICGYWSVFGAEMVLHESCDLWPCMKPHFLSWFISHNIRKLSNNITAYNLPSGGSTWEGFCYITLVIFQKPITVQFSDLH